jgi:hypothetical protein
MFLEGGNRKQSTIDSYERRLRILHEGKDVDNLAFLYDYNVILEKLEKYKPTTQRNFIIAIVSALKHIKVMKSAYDYYSQLLEKYNNELKQNNTKSSTQKDNWINQNEVIEVYKKLYEEIYPILCKKNITEKDFNKIIQLILLSLFVLQEPRRLSDYMNMVIVKKLPKIQNTDLNYYDITNGIFYFNNYKTSGTYKQQSVEVNDKLQELLKCYVKVHPHKLTTKNHIYMLCNYNGEPFKVSSQLTRILNKIFMNYCDKKISINLLRNIYLTETFKPQHDKLNDTAYNMGTSSNMIQNTYIKND